MTTAPIEISVAGENDGKAWDAFVDGNPDATFFHKWGWRRVVEETYGYRAVYLFAKRAGVIVGALPLIDVTSFLFGRSFISTAFTVGGGIASADPDVHVALAAAAREQGEARRVNYVELRAKSPDLEGWEIKNTIYAGFEKRLPEGEEACWNSLPRSRRTNIRKAEEAAKAGDIKISFDHDIESFYRLYSAALRDLGTPVFPRRFVDAIMREFEGAAEIQILEARGEPVLALLSFWYHDRIMPYYVAISPYAREHRLYDFATWRQMRHGAERGEHIYDFGRSKYGSGPFNFKVFWGFEPKPLEYQYALIRARETPNVNPDNPKFARFVAAWQRLPVPVANIAGPMLARHLA